MLDDGNKNGVAACTNQTIVGIESTLHMEKLTKTTSEEKKEKTQSKQSISIHWLFLFELSFLVYPFSIVIFSHYSIVIGGSILWLDYCYSKIKMKKTNESSKTYENSMPMLLERHSSTIQCMISRSIKPV